MMLINYFKKLSFAIFSNVPKIHRIPFGPNKGLRLFSTFNISPRMYFGFHASWVAKLNEEHVSPGDVIYDIGAHIGYTTLLFSKNVGENGQIHSFEILPTVANNYLKRTIDANKLSEVVTIHPVGLSNQTEELELREGKTMMGKINDGGFNTGKAVQCKTVRLDDYIKDHQLQPPSLIKIDVERAEIDCLLGAKSILKEYKPLLIIEFHSMALLREGFTLLKSLGYNLKTEKTEVNEAYLAKHHSFYGDVFCYAS